MGYFNTKYKRQSARITSVIAILILLLLFFTGLNYLDPPIEYGMEVNFGTSNVGSGNVQPLKPVRSQPTQKAQEQPTRSEEKVVEEVEETEPEEKVEEAVVEEVVTTESPEVIAMKKAAEEKRKLEEAEAKRKAEEKARKERERRAQEAKKAKLDALMGGLSKSEGEADGGEGNDDQAGDKGQIDGNPYANSYYGDPGTGGGGGGYGLRGRRKLSNSKVQQNCNQEGRVVVEIVVDKSGKVIKATPGVRGTTNTHPCLMEPAKRTALSYRWNNDGNAPSRQTGFVVVNFKLSQ